MVETLIDNSADVVSFMKAATLAGVHLSTIYKERVKLKAFKKDNSWFVPIDSLHRYISERAKRAQEVVATAAAVKREKPSQKD
jgi:hypothetical protein